MKDGYYYFLPAYLEKEKSNKYETDKSLGYISITCAPDRHVFSIQCSLNKDKIQAIANRRTPIELYISPVTYVTNTSVYIGRFSLSSKNHLFLDASLSSRQILSEEDNQYIIVTSGGRTLIYSLIQEKRPEPVITDETHSANTFGEIFDPFNTTNPAYKWFIHYAKSQGELERIFRTLKIHPEMFGKINNYNTGFSSDTFIKTAYYALRVTGHILRGEYSDPISDRFFTVIGLPGWNIRNRKKSAPSIRIYARWITAQNKPEKLNAGNYNGYWLYYFDKETGYPVKAVLKNN